MADELLWDFERVLGTHYEDSGPLRHQSALFGSASGVVTRSSVRRAASFSATSRSVAAAVSAATGLGGTAATGLGGSFVAASGGASRLISRSLIVLETHTAERFQTWLSQVSP